MIIGQSSQHVEFPAINTIEDTKELFWRTTGLATAYVASDLGAAYEINFVALLAHNITAASTIKAIGADDSDFSTGIVEETIGYAAIDIFHFFSVWQTKRYWKITVFDPTNPDGYIEIATIVLGKYFQANCNYDFGYDEGREDFSILDYSDSMVLHVDEKPILFIGKYEFNLLKNVSREEILLLTKECGVHKGFVVCFNPENADSSSCWVKLTTIDIPIGAGIDTWSWSMDIIEVK